jgi:O-antigen ligase
MISRITTRARANPLLFCIGLGCLLLPVTNAVGQIPLYLASIGWLVLLMQKKVKAVKSTWIGLGIWMGLILAWLPFAVHPELGLDKLNRFLLFPLVGAVTTACLKEKDPMNAVGRICLCLIAGVAILGLHDAVDFPLQVRGGEKFVDVGNMTSPQFYMVGILLWLGMLGTQWRKLPAWFWYCIPLLAGGLLIHQKRGVWLATMAAVGLWTLWSRRWKLMALGIVLAGVSLTFPFVQDRLASLREVIQPTHGGRMVLWNEVAPQMFEAYPWGMGYNGSKYEDFREILPDEIHMEVGLRHLHNNFLQIRLELGWPGALFWSAWMIWILFRAFQCAGKDQPAATAVAFALLALNLNGLVEYNFGDSEVLKLFLLLFGCVDVMQNCRKTTDHTDVH